MKRLSLVFLFFAAFGMLFLGGCSNEEKLLSYENPSSGDGKLTFVLPMEYNGTVTYAAGDSTAGLAAEYEFKNLFIYWFTLDGGVYKWAKTFEYGSGTANDITFVSGTVPSSSGARTGTATVDIGSSDTDSRFYIIANVNLADGVAANGLKQLSPASTSTEFELIASDALAKNTAGYLTPLGTPIPMSIDKASKNAAVAAGYYEIGNPQQAGIVKDVQMKRRVARFDIMNNKDYSGLEVTNIVVSRARAKGWLQDKALNDATDFNPTRGDMYIPATKANGTSGSLDDDEKWVFDTSDPSPANHHWVSTAGQDKIPDDFQGVAPVRDSLEVNPAVFYLWPTVLEATLDATGKPADVTTGTEILIEGKYKNTTKLYRLMLDAETEIKANNRYTIRIARVTENTVGFELTVDHWIEGLNDSIVTSAPVETVTWGALTDESGAVIQDLTNKNTSGPDAEYEYCSDQEVKLILQTEGGTRGNKGVVRVDMTIDGQAGDDYLASDWAATSDPDNVHSKTKVTYGTRYITNDTIYLPPTDAPLEYTMTIYNVAKATDNRVIKLKTNNVGKLGKQLIKLNTILEGATTIPNCAGRWIKAIVIDVDSTNRPQALPTKYGEIYGYGGLNSVLGILEQVKIPSSVLSVIINATNADANATLAKIASNANVSQQLKDMATANAGKAIDMESAKGALIWNAATAMGIGNENAGGAQTISAYMVQKVSQGNAFGLIRQTSISQYGLDGQYGGWTMNNVICPLNY
jgi:hypothetical protein